MPHIRPAGADGYKGPKPSRPRKPRKPARSRAKRPRAAAAPGLAPEPLATRSTWPRAAGAPGVITPLVTVDPDASVAPEPLTLTGAAHGTAGDSRAAFARERDAALNRMWRRPGGLRQLAGL